MIYKRSVIKVSVRLNPIPGWGNKPGDHVKLIQDLLSKSIGHYKPEVSLIKVEEEGMPYQENTIERKGLTIGLYERFTVGGDPLTVYELLVNNKEVALIHTHPDSSEPGIYIPFNK
jgi:hypothetical protein